MAHSIHDDDDVSFNGGSKRRFSDFDCPDCNANNPHGDGLGNGDEVRCYYCGQEFRVMVDEEGKLRLKEL